MKPLTINGATVLFAGIALWQAFQNQWWDFAVFMLLAAALSYPWHRKP